MTRIIHAAAQRRNAERKISLSLDLLLLLLCVIAPLRAKLIFNG